ncbi:MULTISPECIES: LysR family transcriptional regulator [Sphingobium]|uniref:LysR family transcriptional regulator n=1 Tax=Sphingobium chungbukense TaxID=56193 RepID=A0A0M3AQ63_9SPHN|nr:MULTISPECIES: LysR family transcriptional regulator [Sphingobium]KKW90679.1 LysR family transcriptional regulator [Sphingobium chungbukense]PJG46674.1 LysR family transcriptional regulator [Sphingobium sp. LB126]
MLDRYLLRYFLAVVDQGNFSRAASHCNVSQPTLSVGIAKLERTLGMPLFVRSNQRVELTDGGTRFLSHARRIEREFNLAMQSMGMAETLTSLRIGILSSIAGEIVAASVARTRPERQHRFELLFGSERELTGHLAKGRIDVALTLVGRGGDRFLELPVHTEGYALAMAADHPLAQDGEIGADRLANEVMIVRRHCEALSDTSRFFTERGVRPHFALRSTNDERVLQMVGAGLGITVMPQSYRAQDVVRPRLSGFDLTRTLGWAATQDAEHMLRASPPVMAEIARQLVGRG